AVITPGSIIAAFSRRSNCTTTNRPSCSCADTSGACAFRASRISGGPVWPTVSTPSGGEGEDRDKLASKIGRNAVAQPRTFFEKVWADHQIADLGDNTYLLQIDRLFLHEMSG